MRKAEGVWWRILGVVVILFGLTLLISPRISYNSNEQIPHTQYTVKRPKLLVIPRPIAVLVIAIGCLVLVTKGRD
jgi:hypothetical protein